MTQNDRTVNANDKVSNTKKSCTKKKRKKEKALSREEESISSCGVKDKGMKTLEEVAVQAEEITKVPLEEKDKQLRKKKNKKKSKAKEDKDKSKTNKKKKRKEGTPEKHEQPERSIIEEEEEIEAKEGVDLNKIV